MKQLLTGIDRAEEKDTTDSMHVCMGRNDSFGSDEATVQLQVDTLSQVAWDMGFSCNAGVVMIVMQQKREYSLMCGKEGACTAGCGGLADLWPSGVCAAATQSRTNSALPLD